MTDPGWSDYVLSQLTKNEMDSEGHPFVAGLRRVARLLLGPILSSTCRVVSAPQLLLDENSSGKLSMATVEYSIRILWCCPDDLVEGQAAFPVEFQDVADSYYGNTDEEFARYPSSIAATRAEARCLRKALMLQRASAEELTKVPIEETGISGMITPTQKNFIKVICQRCDINIAAYLSSGKQKYVDLDLVPFGVAHKMVQHLSAYQNDQSKIPVEIKGYKNEG